MSRKCQLAYMTLHHGARTFIRVGCMGSHMGDSLPQLTRALASDMDDLRHVAEVTEHDGTTGCVDFKVDSEYSLSASRVSNLLPDGWVANLIVGPDARTSAYVERER